MMLSFLDFVLANFATILLVAAVVDLVCWGTVAVVLLRRRVSSR